MIDLDDGDILDLDLMNSLLHCQACQSEFREPLMLPCQHCFCKQCLLSQYEDKQVKTTRKIRAIPCFTCNSSAIIPAGGVSNYPVSINKMEIQLVIKQLLMQNIISRIGMPRYFNDRDRSHVTTQTPTATDSSRSHDDINRADVDQSTASPITDGDMNIGFRGIGVDKEIQTEESCPVCDDCRSEPDGGSLGSQDCREEGVGESEHATAVTETWSLASDYFNKPNAVLISNNGQLVVSDYNDKCISVYDIISGELIHQMQNIRTTSMVRYSDANNEILLADTKKGCFCVYDSSNGEYLHDLSDKIKCATAGGMCFDADLNLIVADRLTGRLSTFDKEGEVLVKFDSAPSTDTKPAQYGCLNSSVSVTQVTRCPGNERVACVESSRHRVVIYNSDGSLYQVIGQKGTQDGCLLWPSSCCFVTSKEKDISQLLISDTENHRISLFTCVDQANYKFTKHILHSLQVTPMAVTSYNNGSCIAVTSYNRSGKSKIALYTL